MEIKLSQKINPAVFIGIILLALAGLISASTMKPPSSPNQGLSTLHASDSRRTPQANQFQGRQPNPALEKQYQIGISAYKAKQYNKAEQELKKALAIQPDPNAQFYLGMAYTHEQQYTEAKEAFEHVLMMISPEQPLALKARNNMLFVVKQQLFQTGGESKVEKVLNTSLSKASPSNYLPYTLLDGLVIHYDTAHMPIRVYVSDGNGIPGWKPELKEAMTYAMQTWQTGTQNLITFSEVSDPAQADIIVRWRTHFSNNILGLSPTQIINNTLITSDVNLSAAYPDSHNMLSLEELKGIAVHELGHAIGLKGHSPMPEDIMFPTKTHDNNKLSQRDINTITMLYRLDADVQNNSKTSAVQNQKSYYYYTLGVKAHQKQQFNLAMTYYRQALQINPDFMEAQYNLACILTDSGTQMARVRNWVPSKQRLEEAAQLLSQIKNAKGAPRDTSKMLSIVQQNIAAVNQNMAQ